MGYHFILRSETRGRQWLDWMFSEGEGHRNYEFWFGRAYLVLSHARRR